MRAALSSINSTDRQTLQLTMFRHRLQVSVEKPFLLFLCRTLQLYVECLYALAVGVPRKATHHFAFPCFL